MLGGDGDDPTQVIAAIDGPVLLVGHSHGGSVITAAGTTSHFCAYIPADGAAFYAISQRPLAGAALTEAAPTRRGAAVRCGQYFRPPTGVSTLASTASATSAWALR